MKSKKEVILTGSKLLTRQAVKWLKEIFQLTVIDHPGLSELDLSSLIQSQGKKPVGLIHGGTTFFSDYFFKKIPGIKWNIFPGTEPFPIYNRSALDYCRDHDIPVYSTGGGIRAVVETTLQQISEPTFLKKRAAGWRREVPFNITSYHSDEELAVIGLGNLGKEILLRCQASRKFGGIYFSGRKENPDFTEKTRIPFLPSKEAFKANIVVLTVAHIPGATDNYIGRDLLDQTTPHAIIINNVRPQVMNMVETLEFAKARPDVTIIMDASREEMSREYSLGILGKIDECPNMIFTGHTAWKKSYTRKEYGAGVRRIIAENNLA